MSENDENDVHTSRITSEQSQSNAVCVVSAGLEQPVLERLIEQMEKSGLSPKLMETESSDIAKTAGFMFFIFKTPSDCAHLPHASASVSLSLKFSAHFLRLLTYLCHVINIFCHVR
jgi:hypothetical protein